MKDFSNQTSFLSATSSAIEHRQPVEHAEPARKRPRTALERFGEQGAARIASINELAGFRADLGLVERYLGEVVTRPESCTWDNDRTGKAGIKIDYLSVVFSSKGVHELLQGWLIDLLGSERLKVVMPDFTTPSEYMKGNTSRNHYTHKISYYDRSTDKEIASICWGYRDHNKTEHLDIKGGGLPGYTAEHGRAMTKLCKKFGGRLKRVDLAVDFFMGEYSGESAIKEAYRRHMRDEEIGGMSRRQKAKTEGYSFRKAGRPIKANPQHIWSMGDRFWCDAEGASITWGKADGERQNIIYQKGREQGSELYPDWNRYEARFREQDPYRALSLDLLNPTKWLEQWASSCPYFAEIAGVEPVSVHVPIKTIGADLIARRAMRGLVFAGRQYYKAINTAMSLGATKDMVLDFMLWGRRGDLIGECECSDQAVKDGLFENIAASFQKLIKSMGYYDGKFKESLLDSAVLNSARA